MKIIKLFFLFMAFLTFVLSCTKQTEDAEPLIDIEESIDVTETEFYKWLMTPIQGAQSTGDIGLYLHTMIEWTDDAHSLWRRVYFGNGDDIIIEVQDKTIFNESGQYQYILFDYAQQNITDIIIVEGSSSPLLFYKSSLPDTLLLESYDGSQRYKYVFGEGISVLDDIDFLSLFYGKYLSIAPQSDSFIVPYEWRSNEFPNDTWYEIDRDNLPEPISKHKDVYIKLLDRLNARAYNPAFDNQSKRPTDWKVWNNEYVFLLSSNVFSNPCGSRLYFTIRALNDRLVFTIPYITAPVLKYEGDPLDANYDTLIDFSADQKRLLIKGMIDEKLCIMIYNIVTHEEWDKMNNVTASHLTLGNDPASPVQIRDRINGRKYSVKPMTTPLYGILGNVIKECSLYEKPDWNSNVIMQLDSESMDKYKHFDPFGSYEHEIRCIEIINRTDIATTHDGIIDYWYQIQFDSAVNWEPPDNVKRALDWYDYSAYSKTYAEYTGWVFGSNIKLADIILSGVEITSIKLE